MSESVARTKKITRKLGEDADSHDDPLLDCLETVAKLLDRPTTRTALRAGLPLVDNRLTVELFARAAGRAGLSARVLRRPLQKITRLELPAVLVLNSGAACVLVNIDGNAGKVKILLPETGMGEQQLDFAEIEELYSGYAIFVKPQYRPEQQLLSDMEARPDNWFWGTLFTSWPIYRDVFVASFLINLFGLASPFFILNVYDRVVPNAAFETLWVLGIGIAVIYVFELIMRALRGYFVDIAGKKAELRLSSMLFEKVMGLRMEARPKSVGAFSKNLQEFDSVRDFITSFSITALIDMPFVVLSMLALWYIAGMQMLTIQLVAILVLLGYSLAVQAPLKAAVENTYKASAQKSSTVIEGLYGAETIKTLGAESMFQRSIEQAVSYVSKWSAVSRLLSSSVSNVSTFVQNLSVVAVVILGVYMIANGELSQGGLIACVILSRRVIAPMSQVANLATRYHRAKTALGTLNGIMAMPVDRPTGKTFLHRASIEGEVELKNVTFSYPGQQTPVLKNISLRINPGEHVAIIGATGSGKTTLGKLVMGLYEPAEGMVGIDGTDIRQVDPSELRNFIGYVPQDVILFNGSVRENIVLGTHDVTDDTILNAAEIAGVADFVRSNPLGYDMQVGERGAQLSGGQRQCVAIARALLKDPRILLLDEPSNSMDNRTETGLIRKLTEIVQGKTLILITHRSTTLALVDRIIVVDKGAIVADGPKAQVLELLRSGKIRT